VVITSAMRLWVSRAKRALMIAEHAKVPFFYIYFFQLFKFIFVTYVSSYQLSNVPVDVQTMERAWRGCVFAQEIGVVLIVI
jgi:hypothetical protein